IESKLPVIPSTEKIIDKTISNYKPEDIELLTKHLTVTFLNNIIISLLPEHRLYLLTLICFYIKSEEKADFSDMELEFLMRGKYNSNINITLHDFGVPQTTKVPNWIPKDNWNDLLAMSLIPGDLDHFVIAIVSSEKEWKNWFQSPLTASFPKVEMEIENSSKTETIELNEFRKLILYKVLRPDTYIIVLSEYVNKSLEFSPKEIDFNFVFQNEIFKSIIINMGSKSNISNTSSMSRIHKNLFKIVKQYNQTLTALNCNFLSLSELRVAVKNVKDGFVLLKNIHLASKDSIDFIKSLCNSFNTDNEKKPSWRLIMTKVFDHDLPFAITNQSLQVSFDVIDILAHNSIEKNKKLTLDTCLIRPETVIFNAVQHSLNLANNEEISAFIQNFPSDRKFLGFVICLIQGLLQSRQSLTCSGIQKFIPWGLSSLLQIFVSIKQFDTNDLEKLPQHLIKNVYSNYIDDEMDRNYVFDLLKLLINSAKSENISLNGVKIPMPDPTISINEYPNWLEEKIPDRKIDSKVLQLHNELIKFYNTIRAENFIENLEQLWETNSSNVPKLNEELDQDCLYYSIKLCNEKLPPLLPKLDKSELKFDPSNSVAFAIFKEYNIFNEQMKFINSDLKNIEKYLLLNTQLFPKEWKNIALSLQSQRVPEKWEHESTRPSVRPLKSWIAHNFSQVSKINASILKQPNNLFTSIIIQKCFKENLSLTDVELNFVVKDDGKLNSNADGIFLNDIKIIGGKWDASEKCITKSENLVNKLPPLFVFANKINQDSNKVNIEISAYSTNLRQNFIAKFKIPNNCSESVPYLAFDCENDEEHSRRLYRPVLSNIISNHIQSSMNMQDDQSPNLSVAGASMKQTLSRSNQTLQQIREASAEVTKSPESQLSYKPITPNGPPLPAELQKSFTRSKQI
ncbi:dynein beta ciliary-like, partial [Brachionus plicatilis]